MDPGVKRAAVHVEDHPIEYLDFEGIIPSGQYGGGDVIVWDRGTWEPHGTGDAAAAVAAGELHADVHGHKLRGRLVLGRHRRDRSGKDEWLLHKRDQYAVEGWDPADYPRSVLSGRSNDEVKADPRRVWRSDLPPVQHALSAVMPAPSSAGCRHLGGRGGLAGYLPSASTRRSMSSSTLPVFGRSRLSSRSLSSALVRPS